MARRVMTSAAGLLAAVLMTGCGAASTAGAAAVVGGTKFTDQQLSTTVSKAQATLRTLKQAPPPVGQMTSSALNWRIRELLVDVAAKKYNLDASSTEVEAFMQKAYAQYGKSQVLVQLANNGLSDAELPAFGRMSVLQQKVSTRVLGGKTDATAQQALAKFWHDVSVAQAVKVAPRYGVWNNDTLALDPPASTVVSPTASPTTPQ